jgi:hypothetical protein
VSRATLRARTLALLLCLALTAAQTPIQAKQSSGESWLHVRVSEGSGTPETVRINLPLSIVEKVLPAIETEVLQGGRLRLPEEKLEGIDLRALWEAVRSAKDAEYVTVESGSENVRIRKSGGYLLVEASERGARKEQIEIRLPLEVVDALFSSEPGTLDLKAAFAVLKSRGEGEIVRVSAEDSSVRIWIDDKSESR